MPNLNPSRAEELLGAKRAIDRHRWASDPERAEVLLDWTAKAVEVLLREHVERAAHAPTAEEPK
jgi:hypothetical protein